MIVLIWILVTEAIGEPHELLGLPTLALMEVCVEWLILSAVFREQR